MNSIHKRLEGGDLRSIGKAVTVIEDLHKDPSLFDEVFDCLKNGSPAMKSRAKKLKESW